MICVFEHEGTRTQRSVGNLQGSIELNNNLDKYFVLAV
jgi:hypothetical protein